jgi:plastocyanin
LLAAGLRVASLVALDHRRDRMKAIVSLATVLLLLAGVGLGGCGGDDDDEGAATEATTTEEAAGGGGASEVSMTEYAFDPSLLTATEGGLIEVTNDGEEPHNLTVEGQDLATSDLEPGASQQLRLGNGTVLPAGNYDVICTIPGHAEQGMRGNLSVVK